MGSSSERLPSFKGPRDLSLSNRGKASENPSSSGQGQASAAARPKRVFTPNIPPKRDRGTPATGSSSTGQQQTPKDNASSSGHRGGRFQKGRGARGRGAQGNRGGRQRPELQQAESIFSDGIGDPLEARKTSSHQYRTGYDGGRYRNAALEGRSRMSNLNRSTLNTLIKEEEDESNKKIFGTEKFELEEEEDRNAENPNVPVVLPLLTYVPEVMAPPSALVLPGSDVLPGTSSSSGSKQSSQSPVSMVRIKQEKFGLEEEIPASPNATLAQIKQEKKDEFEAVNEDQRNTLLKMSLEPLSFAGTFRSTVKDGTLAYFQFPDKLPILKKSVADSSEAKSSDRKQTAELVDDIDDLPEGFIGRFQILSSGRTRFILGENSFDVDAGRPVGFLQELLSLDNDKNTLTHLGKIDRKFVITPDIECLISDNL